MRRPVLAWHLLLATALAASPSIAQQAPFVFERTGAARSTEPWEQALPELQPGRLYSVSAHLPHLEVDGDPMLRVELFDPTGMPTGKVLHRGDPDLRFVFRPRLPGTSLLRVARATDRNAVPKTIEDATRAVARDRRSVALVQDDARLVDALQEGDGDVRVTEDSAWSGRSAVRARALLRVGKNVAGWGFRIAEDPGPGEYRYLRFAWRLEQGDSAAIALCSDGDLGEPADGRLRYAVGDGLMGWGATKVADAPPREWTVVTRDLFADRGAFTLTGLGLFPMQGVLWLDHAYLGRTIEDLDAITPETVRTAMASGSNDGLAALAPKAPPDVHGPFVDLGNEVAWTVRIREIESAPEDLRCFESEPNDQWNMADEIVLGTEVHGSGDDVEYLDNQQEGRVGLDWLRFSWSEDEPRLVFFSLDCPDRDVPATMRIYVRDEVGRLVPYVRGKDPTEVRHDNQDASIAGWKFVSRVIGKGTYWLHVKANHPSWTLRTTLHRVPPYDDPREAVRTAVEYAQKAGDGFFANVPRGGAVRTRVETNTDETTRCFACHAGHYPAIASLEAKRNGYAVTDAPEFRNLIDRAYEVGVPLYGHDGATWARFDLAPTVGIGRTGTILADFETLVRKRPTEALVGPARFCELVYGARTELPRKGDRTEGGNHEFDGNRPISDARVAREAFRLFDELARRTGDAHWQGLADHMRSLLATARIKDNEDLAEQTVAMLQADPARYRATIEANVAKLLQKRHDDGGWVTAEYLSNLQVNELAKTSPLDLPHLPSLTFFTAQAAWTLLQAGLPTDDAQRGELLQAAAKLVQSRQLEFGGWVDPQGELFRTPYLETKWAVIFLSALFPETTSEALALDAPTTDAKPAVVLRWLEAQQRGTEPGRLDAVARWLAHPLPQVREGAALALQRLAWHAADPSPLPRLIAPLRTLLGDVDKGVARAAALALRALGNDGIGRDELLAALADGDVRTRRFASRVFVHRFWSLAADARCRDAVLARIDDDDFVVRLHAIKAAQQWWYRAAEADKPAILARILARARTDAERAEVLAAITKGLHNVCDENTAELYGNDARVMATDAHREAIRRSRDEVVEKALGEQLAAELRSGNRQSRFAVLRALGQRIALGSTNGNDTDDVVLQGPGGQVLAAELRAALADPDAGIREQAAWAATAVRKHADASFVAALLRAAGDEVAAVRQAALRSLDVLEVRGQDLPGHGVALDLAPLAPSPTENELDRLRGVLRWLRRDPSSQRVEFVPFLTQLAARAVELDLRRLALQDLEWAAEQRNDERARDAIWSALAGDEPALRTEAEIQIERHQTTGGFLLAGRHRWDFVRSALAGGSSEQHERAARFARWHTDDAPWDDLLPSLEDLLRARRPRARADAVDLLLAAAAAGRDVRASLELALSIPEAEPRAKAAVALGYDPDRVPVPAAATGRVDSSLDFDTFAAFVHPILVRPGTTGARACVECHHRDARDAGNFRLVAPADGAPSDEELAANFNATVPFVATQDPIASPLLRKPLNPDRAIGAIHGSGHGGGVSWSEPSDPDFRTVLEWASGKKLDRGEQFHFDEFVDKVLPIFTEIGPTGDACWECHNTHNTLFMPEPENGERYTKQEARQLLDYVLRTVDLRSPQDSFVLNKPMYELDNPFREKDPNRPTHGGGIRWLEGKRSWQYRTMLEWIERVAGRR